MLPAQHECESTSMPQAPIGQGCAVPCTVISQGQSTTVTPGQSFATVVGPPPLISAAQLNVNPFYLKKLTGNIRICQGCRGSL